MPVALNALNSLDFDRKVGNVPLTVPHERVTVEYRRFAVFGLERSILDDRPGETYGEIRARGLCVGKCDVFCVVGRTAEIVPIDVIKECLGSWLLPSVGIGTRTTRPTMMLRRDIAARPNVFAVTRSSLKRASPPPIFQPNSYFPLSLSLRPPMAF